jgi:hypothetical protein
MADRMSGKDLKSSALRAIFRRLGGDKRGRFLYERARNGIFPTNQQRMTDAFALPYRAIPEALPTVFNTALWLLNHK